MQDKNHLRNNFDFLRFGAAALVIYSHSYGLLGLNMDIFDLPAYTSWGRLGVSVFFVISGYLITGSWQRSADFRSYFKKRALRIFPAFWISVLLCLLVIGSWVTTLPLRDYFANSGTWRYGLNLTLYIPVFHLPGVFESQPNTGVNSVYWTLPVEFTCYLAVALLGATRLLRGPAVLACAIAALLLFAFADVPLLLLQRAMPSHQGMLHLLYGEKFAEGYLLAILYCGQFLIGSLLYLWRERIPWKASWFAALLLCTLLLASLPHGIWALHLALPYLVIYIAHTKLPWVTHFGKYGDFSYGLYLWGFPIQQLWVHALGTQLHPLQLFCLAFPVALLCAAFSWHLIEAPMLRLKPKT